MVAWWLNYPIGILSASIFGKPNCTQKSTNYSI